MLVDGHGEVAGSPGGCHDLVLTVPHRVALIGGEPRLVAARSDPVASHDPGAVAPLDRRAECVDVSSKGYFDDIALAVVRVLERIDRSGDPAF